MKQALGRHIRFINLGMVLAAFSVSSPAQTTQGPPGTSCTGLCLKQVACPGGGFTSVSGKVSAPNGTDPIYNALVYVPNGEVQAFVPGVACVHCGTEVTGQPLISTLTGPDGTFRLENMPAGVNIPLVIQIGRWRRQITIPTVLACVNTALPSSLTRLPRTKAEGDIPLMAIVTGQADGLECLFRKIGISDSEFSNPAAQGGAGRVRFYKGEGAPGAVISASTPSGAQLSGSQVEINQYDIVFFPNPGVEFLETAAAQQQVINYVNSGGRVLATRYSYVWLFNAAPFSGTAQWHVDQASPTDQTAYINTSFPRGQALAQWLQTVGASTTFGQLPMTNLRHDFDGVVAPSLLWISLGAPPTGPFTVPSHYTFDAPISGNPTNQCGRVLYNDYIAEAGNNANLVFPSECPSGGMTPQEKLLEFAIFDLGSCFNSSLGFTSVTNDSNHWIIRGQGAPSYPATIQAARNINAGFTNLGTATSSSNGTFQYMEPTNLSQRFYRAFYP